MIGGQRMSGRFFIALVGGDHAEESLKLQSSKRIYFSNVEITTRENR